MEINKLRTKIIGKKILFMGEIGSSNDEARRLAQLGYGEGTVVIASSQLKGKGRLGRRWISPPGGLYLSIILKPYSSPSKLPLITIFSLLSAVRTLRGLTKLDVGVKWPNDIVIADKKLGGILCEAAKNTVVVGIGINLNVNISLFPKALKKQVTSIKFELGLNVNRDKVLRIFLEEFDKLYRDFLGKKHDDIIKEWSGLCQTLGSRVKIETTRGEVHGIAESIGEKGELRVRCSDGKIKKVFSGDVVKVNTMENI